MKIAFDDFQKFLDDEVSAKKLELKNDVHFDGSISDSNKTVFGRVVAASQQEGTKGLDQREIIGNLFIFLFAGVSVVCGVGLAYHPAKDILSMRQQLIPLLSHWLCWHLTQGNRSGCISISSLSWVIPNQYVHPLNCRKLLFITTHNRNSTIMVHLHPFYIASMKHSVFIVSHVYIDL